MAIFSVKDLTFAYPGETEPAIKQVNLDIEPGSYVVLCGRSGCGKTTLLRHLKTVLAPNGASRGTVEFKGRELAQVDQREQSASIGFVMQNPDSQLVTDKVWHELAFGLESLGTEQRVMRLRVAEMANYFGIQHWFHKDVRDLSGGQKQLLNLASIMTMQPDVLILDEPTSQLDPIAAADFLNTIRKINIELGTTVIMTEHRLEDVFPAADRVVVMSEGSIVADGTPREVGKVLHERDDEMQAALPAPMRIFYGCARDGDDVSFGDCPLTVREGRAWLTGAYGAKAAAAPEKCALPDEEAYEEPDDGKLAVQLKDVWFRYERDLPDVLRDTTIEVERGSFHAIVGGNGTGKSTMLKVACGAKKPYRGTVKVLGRSLKSYKGNDLFRQGLAMLPQDPQNLFVKKTVKEDFLLVLSDDGVTGPEAESLAQQVAETVNVAHLLDRHPFDLSGGEQQRAALGIVLLCRPKVLLLDEPTKGIDSFFKHELASVLNRLREDGLTIVMVSHDVEFCAQYATCVSMFFDGSVVTTNSPKRFFSQNSFYTTAANRMSRHLFSNAVIDQDVIALCRNL